MLVSLASSPLELEFQVIVNCPAWVLGTELRTRPTPFGNFGNRVSPFSAGESQFIVSCLELPSAWIPVAHLLKGHFRKRIYMASLGLSHSL